MKSYFRILLVSLAVFFGATQAGARELPDFTELAEKQGPTVVNISTVQTVRNRGAFPQIPDLDENDPMFEFFRRFIPRQPGVPKEFQSRSLGSGFIVSGDGYILTNAHVVDGAEEILVKLNDKREFKAKVIGTDKRTDVALIKIPVTGLPAARLGDPGKLRVGEWVVAIGSPFGFDNTVTAGIVSAKGRSLPQENYVPFIQTDAAVNPGNSGGPLFNLKGEVVGINSQIYSRTGGFMGLSFAIPIDVAMEVQSQLRASGRVSRGRIGVVIQELTRELADSFGLQKNAGALVNSVEKGGPADKAGIEAGDVILKFDGKPVAASSDLPRMVGGTRPSSKAIVQLWRKGATRDVTVTVGEIPDDKIAARGTKKPKAAAAANRYGLVLADLNADQRKELGIEGGVLVEDVQNGNRASDIRPGDILLALIVKGNSTTIRSVEQFNRTIGQLDKAVAVTVLIRRGENQTFVTLKNAG
ncbi:MAG: protease Do [Betaproteobacteria bacterium CG2_30_68_42]|nr:MAG: protease Do [Betaproteobacteria bacterium CG2_30_68_42]PIX76201.1 MAG: protease Do [Rhodocyclales bacterium CG_4_10_14_3_um_filter_68_10]PJA57436.1 MAG: protease Do [Rhodocyclales bacterium CG_4_9_14_3_um_filter_68_10]